MKRYNVAVVGATGLVGETMIRILEERSFPVNRLVPLASVFSKGKSVKFCGKDIPVEVLNKESFNDIDFALFSAGADVSLEYAPVAVKAGAIVIDNSSAFRMEKDIPLVVPEVNGKEARGLKGKGHGGRIIANPNCSTIQLVCVLKPLHDVAGIKRVVVSTYQSVSGAGREAMEELELEVCHPRKSGDPVNASACGISLRQTASAKLPPLKGLRQKAGGQAITTSGTTSQIFPYQIAFNCIPRIDTVEENGYTKEEMKVVKEAKKILGDDSIAVTCTAVRIPVKVGHSESVNIEFGKPLSATAARKVLQRAEGVVVIDEPFKDRYPFPILAEGKDDVFVGRIREDTSRPGCLDLWIVADNIRKGAALNAVQIAEEIIKTNV